MNIHFYQCLMIISIISLISCSVHKVEQQVLAKNNDPVSTKKMKRGERAFSIYDVDKNGLLSRDEYYYFEKHIEDKVKLARGKKKQSLPLLRFEEVDSDKDGFINEDEMISALNLRLQKHRRYRYRGGQK
ncbi:MAG: hypothetical protein DIZ80_14340 [endosymbiont of Galathealinum brachiosum]|uniref:EF-hand domain-containing protein n=1 Tax=endosymbiont of Galathealinum brachiosum TaxID=2200906 RepID=A0A370D8Q9_9GAMM|nr:MAG: hypothetical protein DIZ80_14340 [endosymbiont of Galathealinum brachiosum]